MKDCLLLEAVFDRNSLIAEGVWEKTWRKAACWLVHRLVLSLTTC